MCVTLTLAFATGCRNIFRDLTSTKTNDALFADAKTAINERDYSLALDKLLGTTPEYQARPEVIITVAAAYAGRCGLDFLRVARSILDQPTTRLFPLLLANFRGAVNANVDDCARAQTWGRKLAPNNQFGQLTADQNLFLALSSLAEIGAILAAYADLDHDGVADPSFDACNAAKLPEAKSRQLGVALNLALTTLSASGTSGIASATSGVSSTCSSLPAGQNFCAILDPADFTAPMLKVLGGLIGSNDVAGLGTCNDTFANCICP